jgi:hypothetical protein
MEEQYVNSLELNMGFYDVTTVFKRESSLNTNGAINIITDDLVKIRMSIQLAKAFNKLLEENIKKYEDLYGKIPDMPSPIETNQVE